MVTGNLACATLKTTFPREDYITVLELIVLYRADIGAGFMGALAAFLLVYRYMRVFIDVK
jgi:hypothetical protein